MEIQSTTTGWSGRVYAAGRGPLPQTIEDARWTEVGTITDAQRRTKVPLQTAGKAYRWYLVWIEQLGALNDKVEIGEIYLKR